MSTIPIIISNLLFACLRAAEPRADAFCHLSTVTPRSLSGVVTATVEPISVGGVWVIFAPVHNCTLINTEFNPAFSFPSAQSALAPRPHNSHSGRGAAAILEGRAVAGGKGLTTLPKCFVSPPSALSVMPKMAVAHLQPLSVSPMRSNHGGSCL